MIFPKNPVPPGNAFMFDHCVGNKKNVRGALLLPNLFLALGFDPLRPGLKLSKSHDNLRRTGSDRLQLADTIQKLPYSVSQNLGNA